MQNNNKIKAKAQEIDVESAQFQQFINALKEHRPIKSNKPKQLEINHSLASHPINSEQELSPISKELFSQGSRSLYFNSNRTAEHVSVSFGGDETLKNKNKVGVANRYAVKQYQLPPQYFTPTKLKLQQFLKDSRILSHNDVTVNAKIIRQKHSQKVTSVQNKPLKLQSKVLKIAELNAEVVLNYCIAYQLSQHSQSKQIQRFFDKLLHILDYSMPNAKIEKYRDYIYYGLGTKRRQIGQGFLYFYSGSIYLGELFQHYMDGKGTQIIFDSGAIYRGEFREGRFIDRNNAVSKNLLSNKHQTNFRIRGGSQQKSHYQQNQIYSYNKNKSFNDQFYYQQQPDMDVWSYPERTSRIRKIKPHSNFSDLIQFSYPFGNQFTYQQQPKKQKVYRNKNELIHNPQAMFTRQRLSLSKEQLKQMAYFNRVRPICEQPDSNQQQPLQLKC